MHQHLFQLNQTSNFQAKNKKVKEEFATELRKVILQQKEETDLLLPLLLLLLLLHLSSHQLPEGGQLPLGGPVGGRVALGQRPELVDGVGLDLALE